MSLARCGEHGDAALAVAAAKRAANCAALVARDRNIDLVSDRVGRNGMIPAGASYADIGAWLFVAGLGVNDPQSLIGAGRRLGQKVMSVTLVEPDFVRTVLIGEHVDDGATALIDDHCRRHRVIGIVAAEQNLVLGAERHSLR